MIGLKTFIPALAQEIGRTTDQLYWRQRELVGAGALKPRKGRGPGSGVELTGDSVAMLLLTVMASDLRNEAVERAKTFAKFKPDAFSECPITKAPTLRGAIAAGLDCEGKFGGDQARLIQIHLFRDAEAARLHWTTSQGIRRIDFSRSGSGIVDGFHVTAALTNVNKVIELITAAWMDNPPAGTDE